MYQIIMKAVIIKKYMFAFVMFLLLPCVHQKHFNIIKLYRVYVKKY